MSENQTEEKTSKPEPRWWKPYWIILVFATIVIGITLPLTQVISWERAIILLVFVLVVEGLAYYGRVKPSVTLNRVMYILMGLPIGFVLWFILVLFARSVFGSGVSGDLVFFIGSLAVCIGIGAVIGDLIGRARHYKGPEQYQP